MGIESRFTLEALEYRVLMSSGAEAVPPIVAEAVPELRVAWNRRQPRPQLNVLARYEGSLSKRRITTGFVLNVTSQEANGHFGGTITFNTDGGATTSIITGTIRGRSLRFGGNFGDAGVSGRGRLAPDASTIRGSVVQEVLFVGKRRTARLRSAMAASRTAGNANQQPAGGVGVDEPQPIPCGCAVA